MDTKYQYTPESQVLTIIAPDGSKSYKEDYHPSLHDKEIFFSLLFDHISNGGTVLEIAAKANATAAEIYSAIAEDNKYAELMEKAENMRVKVWRDKVAKLMLSTDKDDHAIATKLQKAIQEEREIRNLEKEQEFLDDKTPTFVMVRHISEFSETPQDEVEQQIKERFPLKQVEGLPHVSTKDL